MKHRFLETFLERRSQVAMACCDLVCALAPWSQLCFEEPAGGGIVFPFFRRAVQRKGGNPDRSVWEVFHRFFEKGPELVRASVGSESHDLVLVAVEVETKVHGDQGIQNSDGMQRRNRVQLFQFTV